MSKKLYIGISGKMGSGKSTLTQGLIRNLEIDNRFTTEVVSLAKPIKDCQDKIYETLDMEMEGEKDRDLLIALGMWARNKDPDFWLKKAVELKEASTANVVICDDVRFRNEADWYKKNGILLRMVGNQYGSNVDHNINATSETALDNYAFPFYVDNTGGTERTLNNALHCILKHMNVQL